MDSMRKDLIVFQDIPHENNYGPSKWVQSTMIKTVVGQYLHHSTTINI